MNNTVRKLPKGIQSFEKIRKQGYLYVDKTDLLWELANSDQNIFLNRPRRFGKSLLSDTMARYYEGRKDLFEGLKIMEKEHDWVKRAVFRFDFSGKETARELTESLDFALEVYEKQYIPATEVRAKTLADRVLHLMRNAYQQTGHEVAVIVDEYDAPLQHTLYKPREHEKLVEVYRSFFPAFKTGDSFLKCLFITGITKFTQLSLFSVLNNVTVLSANPQYATLFGFTHKEIEEYFQPEIKAMAAKNGWTIEETLSELREAYDGYHFSDDISPEKAVYNPYSLLNALDQGLIDDYWASSGGSSLLSEMLRNNEQYADEKFERISIRGKVLRNADVSTTNLPLFLYQCGYLTIKDYDGEYYTVGIPNQEVRSALYDIVLPNALGKIETEVASEISLMRDALVADDVDRCMEQLKRLISTTPYGSRDEKRLEERYRFIVVQAFYLMGARVEQEKHVAGGIIDVVVRFRNIVLVMELKLYSRGGLEAALQQIKSHGYTDAFVGKGDDVWAVALEFSSAQDRALTRYAVERRG